MSFFRRLVNRLRKAQGIEAEYEGPRCEECEEVPVEKPGQYCSIDCMVESLGEILSLNYEGER